MINADAVRVGDQLRLKETIFPTPDEIRPYLGGIVTVSAVAHNGNLIGLAEMGNKQHWFHYGCFEPLPDDPEIVVSPDAIADFLGF